MARVAAEELERLKRDISVQRLAEARGIRLKRHGKDLLGLCPFHDDKEPSLVISPEKNLWHCLGACQAGGSVVDWVMRAEGVSFRHAVELLRNDAAFSAPGREKSGKKGQPLKVSSVRQLEPPVSRQAEDHELLAQVVAYYHETLKQSPEALDYLKSRGLDHPEMVERFQLGFANRTLGLRLPAKNRLAGSELRSRLQQRGILRESGHEHFNGCIVFPVLDEHGRVAEIYGRKITPGLRPGTPLHLYLPGPHRGVFNLEALMASKEIILCEALIDALTFWCAGFRHVTTSYGIEGFTADHLEAFQRYGTERVLIAYDRDGAGDQAAEALAEKLTAVGLDCFRVQFPRGLDANEYALKVQPAEKSLGLALRQAVWMGKGKAPRERPAPAAKATAPVPVIVEPTATPAPDPPLAAAFSEPPPSSLLPPPPAAPTVPAEVKAEEVVITLGDRRWRVRGLAKNVSYDALRVNLLASRGEGFHVDTLDLYSARQRAVFTKQAAEELRLEEAAVGKDLGKVLLKLEELQEEQIKKALEPKDKRPAMTDPEKAEALALLQDPNLLERIPEDLERCGLVGETVNKLVAYLAAVSRKLDKPLAVLIQSSTAAGKSSLMEAVLALMPEEERVSYSAMTGQALFYMSEVDLKHKILAIAEEQGAEKASYALKLLQSEGELTIASTGKDPHSGRLVTHEYKVEGPVMLLSTTTAIDIDEELLNRCLVLAVDEGREQTRAIHQLQRKSRTLAGFFARQEREALRRLHQNAQRLLRPLPVINPFAERLTFLDAGTRTRRDHDKYLTLIETLALLHQHQRPIKTGTHAGKSYEYIEVELADIERANHLASEILGRTLDELPPQTRCLLELLDAMVAAACETLKIDRADYRFTRREVREHVHWSDFQVKKHMQRLLELEYLLAHRGGRGQSFVYELVYDGQGRRGEPFLMGLLDTAKLREAETYDYDKKKEPPESHSEPPKSPQGAAMEPRWSPAKTHRRDYKNRGFSDSELEPRQNAGIGRTSEKHIVGVAAPAQVLPPLAASARP